MRLVSSLLLACLLSSAAAAAPNAPSHVFEGKDLFSLQAASDPQIRPDGHQIAYVRTSFDIMTDRPRRSIWLIDIDSGLQIPLSAGAGSSYSPRWSPDGKRLAYVSTSEGGRSQLYVRWMQSEQSARVTDLTESPSALDWSPDGRFIAFMMLTPEEKNTLGSAPQRPEGANWAEPLTVISDVKYRADGAGYLKPGYTHAYIVSAEGGFPRQLTFGAFNEEGPISFSPDGHYILLSGNRTEGWQRDPVNTEIYQVSVADATITELTHRVGPDNAPHASPDGKHIAYLGFDDKLLGYQDVRVYLMDRDGKNPRSLTDQLDRSVRDVRWAADGRGLFVLYTDKAVTKVARLSLNGQIQMIAEGLAGGGEIDRPYTGGEFTVSTNGIVAFTAGASDQPPEISVARSGRITRLTHLNDELFAVRQLARVEPLPVTSSFDHRPIDAWLVKPANFDPQKKYPLILEIHGGPYASYGPVFSTDDQLYAAAGYLVAFSNPRGSTSYGEEFANQIQHDYPSHDYDDLMSVVDAAIATGAADPQQLYVTGGSGGGVLTAWIVGRTQRFKAAATQKPVINWTSMALTSDIATYLPKYWFGKAPWEDPEIYWKHSPLSQVAKVTTPTLVVVGSEDYRTPVSDAEQFYEALQLRGVPTELVKVPGASHGGLTDRPSQSAAKASAILAWFARYKSATSADTRSGGAAETSASSGR